MKTVVMVFLFLALAVSLRAEDDVWIRLLGSGNNLVSVPERSATTRLVNMQDLLAVTGANAVSWSDITTSGGTVFKSYVRGLNSFPPPLVKGEAYNLQMSRKSILELHSNPSIVSGQKLIVFISDRQSKTATKVSRLHLMNEDGSEQRAMFAYEDLNQLDPTWDPTGEFVYWAQQEVSGDNRMFSIFRARPDGTGMLRMTNTNPDGSFNGIAGPNSLPRLSWDGKYLFYVKLRVSGFNIIEGDLHRQDMTTKADVNLTPDTLGSDDETPVPSPDARYVFFTSNRGNSYQVWRMDWDGTNLVQLTTDSIGAGVADISFNGLVLWEGSVEGKPKMFTIDESGRNILPVTTENYYQDDAAFSKFQNSRRITFDSNIDGNLEVYSIGADGNDRKRLTFNVSTDKSASMQP